MNRRTAFSALVAGISTILATRTARAQKTAQEVLNELQVTSTGNVTVEQAASGQQEVGILVGGEVQTADGIYRTETGQAVINDGQITATGDVDVVQSASGQQEVTVVRLQQDWYDGMPAEVCETGKVIADPNGVLYYQRADCCLYEVPCCVKPTCKNGRCEGHGKYE